MKKRRIGDTELEVTEYSFGGASLGGLYRACLARGLRWRRCERPGTAGMRYFDTAPFMVSACPNGGSAIILRDKPRDSYVLSTKVGRLLRPVPEDQVPNLRLCRSAALQAGIRLFL